jgi:predicted ABC-type transport system involved in lysophospholipase L1 biosynthesis ATPase subunit
VTAPVLELAEVAKSYGALRPLRIAKLAVAPAEQVALIGIDRPGAEIFINLVTGATLPDRGEIRLFGRPTSAIADGVEWLQSVDRFGIVSERAVLLDGLSVIQNLAVPFTLDIEPVPDAFRVRAEALATEVGLAESVWLRPVRELSPAELVLIRLARALALEPAILLLEHASASLPAIDAPSLGAVIRGVAARRGAAVVALTADAAFAAAVASRVLTLDPATGRLNDRRSWWSRRS